MDALQVEFEVKGLSVEKLLNEARKRGVTLRAVRRQGGRKLSLRCSRGDYARIREAAEERGYEIGPARPVGLLRLLTRAGRRRGLLAGCALCVGLAVYALGLVWQVKIENAGAYAGEVRRFLLEQGIAPGIRRSQVQTGALRDALEWYLPAVKWVRVSWEGVALKISVEEGTPPPPVETEGGPGDVVAAEDGLVTGVMTYAGTAKVKPGDFVRAGQVLIAGTERGAGEEMRPVKARGAVTARVWVTARVRLPLTEWRSVPTGRETRRRVLAAPFFSWSPQEAPAYLTFDREVMETPVGGAWFPILLRRETWIENALEKGKRPAESVLMEAEEAALRLLNERLKNEETVDKWINFRMIEGETIVVEAAGEIRRQIGRCRKNPP